MTDARWRINNYNAKDNEWKLLKGISLKEIERKKNMIDEIDREELKYDGNDGSYQVRKAITYIKENIDKIVYDVTYWSIKYNATKETSPDVSKIYKSKIDKLNTLVTEFQVKLEALENLKKEYFDKED